MKMNMINISMIALVSGVILGCGSNSSDESILEDDNITINAQESDDAAMGSGDDSPAGTSEISPEVNGSELVPDCGGSLLPDVQCNENGGQNLIISYTPQPLDFKPLVDMEVGVDHEWCNRVVPEGVVKYVATTGDDATADGSMASPYRTVFKAVEEAQAGEMIVIRGGTYVETGEIRLRVPNVTITSYPDEWAIIDRSSSTYVGSEDSGIYLDVDADGSTVQCLEVKGGLYAISTETKWDWDEVDKMGATNITVANVKAHDSYADVIRVKPNSDEFNITYSEIYNSGIGQDPNECNAEGIDNVNSDNMSASHLYIHHICSNGIYFKGGAGDGEISYSLIENTGEGGIMLGFDTSPEYFDLSTNPNMYESMGGKAHHNLIRNAQGAGIGFYASRGAEAYNNTIINASARFHAPIYFGITLQDGDADAKRPANVYPEVHHNIVVQTRIKDRPLVAIRYSDELGGLSGLSGILNIDNNCYFQESDTGLIALSASFEDGRYGGWEGNFVAWQQHISNDKNSKEVDPALDINGVATNVECKFMGYTVGHSPTDGLTLGD